MRHLEIFCMFWSRRMLILVITAIVILSSAARAVATSSTFATRSDIDNSTAASAVTTSTEYDRNLVNFLRQIGAISSTDEIGSANVQALVDVFALFLLRRNLSVATVQAAFFNESYTLGELFSSPTAQPPQPPLRANLNGRYNVAQQGKTPTLGKETGDAIRTLFAMPNPARTIVQTAYLILIVTALVGNCTVILVYTIAKRWRDDISVFHVQLALADILMATFCIPFTMQQVLNHFWTWPIALCSPVLFVQLFSVCVSIFTLVCIGMDRLLFVWYPLRQRLSAGRKSKLTMLFIALAAGTIASIQLPFITVLRTVIPSSKGDGENEELLECKFTNDGNSLTSITVGTICLTYLVPLPFLVAIYACIGQAVWTRQPPGQRLSHVARERLVQAQKRQIIKSLILIVTLFALAWLPLNAFIFAFTVSPKTFVPSLDEVAGQYEQSKAVNRVRWFYLPCHFIAMTSTCINPIIYAFMHSSFRNDCRRIWWQTKRFILRQPQHPRNLSACTSLASFNGDGGGSGNRYKYSGPMMRTTSLRVHTPARTGSQIDTKTSLQYPPARVKHSVSLMRRHTSAEYLALTPLRSPSPVETQQSNRSVCWVSPSPLLLPGYGINNGSLQQQQQQQPLEASTTFAPLLRENRITTVGARRQPAPRHMLIPVMTPQDAAVAWSAYRNSLQMAVSSAANASETVSVKQSPAKKSSRLGLSSSSRRIHQKCLAFFKTKSSAGRQQVEEVENKEENNTFPAEALA